MNTGLEATAIRNEAGLLARYHLHGLERRRQRLFPAGTVLAGKQVQRA